MKAQLRKDFLLRRESLSRKDFIHFNTLLLCQVSKIDWSRFKYVHVFLPIRERQEVDTFELISYFKENHPEISIVIPKTDFLNKRMDNILFDYELTILQKNRYHIPEPVYGEVIPDEKIDVVFVPLLTFDKTGNRIGYGGGFYDRFLALCREDVYKVGLSLFDPLEQIIESESFDIKMDACLTPYNTFYF